MSATSFHVFWPNNSPTTDSLPYDPIQLSASNSWNFFEGGRYLLAGRPLGSRSLVEIITSAIHFNDWEGFQSIDGAYCIVVWDEKKHRLICISDLRAQQHLYVAQSEHGLHIASDIGLLLKQAELRCIDKSWIFELIYFNYPLFETTPSSKIKRLTPATFQWYSAPDASPVRIPYKGFPRIKDDLLSGKQAQSLVLESLRKAVKARLLADGDVGCSFTCGWDGRTIYSLLPEARTIAYTYGIPGCEDMRVAEDHCSRIGARHLSVPLSEEFVSNLPHHIGETIQTSCGYEKLSRSSINYVYSYLSQSGIKQVFTGIAFDGMFKGRMAPKYIVSSGLANIFSQGRSAADFISLGVFLPEMKSPAEEWIIAKLDRLENSFGDFQSPLHHLLYDLYCIHPCYFSGEVKVASNYLIHEVPCWDMNVVDAAMTVACSTIKYSQFATGERDGYERYLLQSKIIVSQHSRLSKLAIRNHRPDFLAKSRFRDACYHAVKAASNKLENRRAGPRPPLEDWKRWLMVDHRDFFLSILFAEDALWPEYFETHAIVAALKREDMFLLEKIARIELLYREHLKLKTSGHGQRYGDFESVS